jgi:hypothetical protein
VCQLSPMLMKLKLALFALALATGCSERNAAQRACTPPLTAWGKPHPHLGPDVLEITIGLDHNGATYLNGKAATLNDISKLLQQAAPLNPRPIVMLETEMGAPCATLDKVRELMNERLACERGGHCDEGMQTVWSELPSTGPGVP